VTIVLIAVAAIAVFSIAAIVIGREARRLDAVAPRAVYVLEEAAEFVSDNVPPASQARLTPAEVRELLRRHMALLRAKGLQPRVAVDQVQDIATPVVLDDTGLVGYLIARAEEAGFDVDDADVANVVEAHLAYLDAIGAIGPVATDPDATRPPHHGRPASGPA
jgi:hypothetical protein